MSNTKTRALPETIMSRVKACAILFLDSPRKEKITAIAIAKGVTLDNAAVMYTLGALKAAKKRGTARNYTEALNALEAEQVGDRGNNITRSISADDTARTVARINRINAGNQYTPDYYTVDNSGMDWVRIGWAHMDNQPCTVPVHTPHYPDTVKHTNTTTRSMGKVLGTLYTEWESREGDLDPALITNNAAMQAEQAQVKKNLQLFFAEYADRLGKTAKARLYELAESTVKAGYLFGNGKTDPDTKRLAWGAYRLYAAFPHHDAITGIEFVNLVRLYISVPANRV